MNVATDQDPTIDTPSIPLIKGPNALCSYCMRVDACRPGQDWRSRAGHADNRVSIDRLVSIIAQLATMPGLAVQSS